VTEIIVKLYNLEGKQNWIFSSGQISFNISEIFLLGKPFNLGKLVLKDWENIFSLVLLKNFLRIKEKLLLINFLF
jgi:hypothetical protein